MKTISFILCLLFSSVYAELTPEQWQSYVNVYLNPNVIQIQLALGDFCRFGHTNDEPQNTDDTLRAYKQYFKSRGVVMSLEQNMEGGGYNVLTLFLDRPDRFFTFWVYQRAEGEYVLRGVCTQKIKDKDLIPIQQTFREFLRDTIDTF